MLRYFESASAVVERHGGTVEKFIGDAVMAVFGVPTALEDHAGRAVRAALELQEELARLNGELQREWGVQIAIRTGVNSGEVVAGDASAGQALVTGDAVNVAARLQQAAAAGETLIGDATRRLVGDDVEAEARRAAVGARQGGAADGVAAGRHPRTGEPRTWARCRAASPSCASCARPSSAWPTSAAPQRVVAARARPASARRGSRARSATTLSERATVLVGRCLPYGEGITFWALAEIVRQLAGERGPARGARARRSPDDPRAERARRPRPAGRRPRGGDGAREDLTGAVRDLFAALARERPVVLVFEDLHWAEPALLDLIEHLLEHTTRRPADAGLPGAPGADRAAAATGRARPTTPRCSSSGRCRRRTRAR